MEIPALSSGYANVGCCVLYDGRRFGVGLTPGFELSSGAARALRDGATLGDVVKGETGAIGHLTDGVLTRESCAAQAVMRACTRLLHPEWYEGTA